MDEVTPTNASDVQVIGAASRRGDPPAWWFSVRQKGTGV